jgi:hypothetical protein
MRPLLPRNAGLVGFGKVSCCASTLHAASCAAGGVCRDVRWQVRGGARADGRLMRLFKKERLWSGVAVCMWASGGVAGGKAKKVV